MNVASPGRNTWIIAAVVAAAFAIHVSEGRAGAEAQGGMAEELLLLKEETVSIAARHEQPISQAPSDVYVITDEDIRQSGAPDLPTVLRRVPGIEVMQMSGAEFNVSTRGDNQTDANKMLVMVDGRSIYGDIQGTVFWKAIPVTLPEIKRIEVLIGPASVLYGFNAFDGIINIITKSPEEMKGTTLQFGGGEFGTISSAAIQAGTVGKFGYRLSAGHDQNQQWRNRDALAFRDNKFNLQTEYALTSDSKLLVSGGLVDVNRFDGVITEVVAESTRLSQGYADVAYERPNFFLRAWWTEFNVTSDQGVNPLLANFLRVTDRNGSSQENGTFNTYNVEAQHTLQIGGANQLTYGVNYRLNTAADNTLDGFSHENRFGIYVNDQWHVTQTLSLVGGARYDLDTFIHPTISPRLALIYQVAPEHTVRAALSVAYRPPTIFETHLNVLGNVMLPPPIPSPPPTPSLGSTNLNPEEIVSYDLGYQGWFVRHRLRVRGDLFFNHLSNLINNRPTASGIAADVNDPGQADIYGGAAGIEFVATPWLSGFANFSYEEIGQSFTDTVRRGAPRFKANAGVRGDWGNGLNGEAALYHVGAATYPIANSFTAFSPLFPPGVTTPSTRVGSYNLLNLRVGYQFWHEKAEVAVSAFNALNDRHKEDPLGDTIGSRVMGWVTIRF